MTEEQATRHLLGLAGPDRAAAQILVDALAGERELVVALTAQVAVLRGLQTLGGEPPPFNDRSWRNRAVGAGVHPDYQGRL